MSHEITPRAYKTKLGNSTAKNVLAALADQVNADGFGWPSVRYIVEVTEVKRRTVMRMIQVFVDIGLLSRSQAVRGTRVVPAFQINLSSLGQDLAAEFADAYARAQSKVVESAAEECRSDTSDGVAETLFDVAATPQSVAATLPPHPLIGGTVSEPLETHAPQPPHAGEDGFTPEQRESLEQCSPGSRAKFEAFYREENCKAAAQAARPLAEQVRRQKLREYLATIELAREWIKRQCGFVSSGKNRGIDAVLDAVLTAETNRGSPLWESAPRMADAWMTFRANGEVIDVRWGPVNFFRMGIWQDERGWAWNQAKIDRRNGSRMGMSA